MQMCFDEVLHSFPLLQSLPPHHSSFQFHVFSFFFSFFFSPLLRAVASGICTNGGSSRGSLVSQWPHHWGKLAFTHLAAISCLSSSASDGDFGTNSPLHARIVSAWFCLSQLPWVRMCRCHIVSGKSCFAVVSTASDFYNLPVPYSATLLLELQLSFYIFPTPPEKFVK